MQCEHLLRTAAVIPARMVSWPSWCLVLFDKQWLGDLSGKGRQCLPPFLSFLWYQLNIGPLETSTRQGICICGSWVVGSVLSLPLGHIDLVGQINAGVGLSAASWPLGMVTKHGHPQWPVGWEEGIQLLNHAFSSLHSLFLLN